MTDSSFLVDIREFTEPFTSHTAFLKSYVIVDGVWSTGTKGGTNLVVFQIHSFESNKGTAEDNTFYNLNCCLCNRKNKENGYMCLPFAVKTHNVFLYKFAIFRRWETHLEVGGWIKMGFQILENLYFVA